MKARLLSTRFVLTFSLIAALFAFVSILYAGASVPLENTLIRRTRPAVLSYGWSARTPDGSIPLTEISRLASDTVDKTLTLENTLPSTVPGNMSLCFKTKNEMVRLWIGDRLTYTYGQIPQKVYGHGVGAIWNFVELPDDAAGQRITVELTPIGGRTGLEPYRFMIGSYDGLWAELLNEAWVSVLASLLLALIGLVTMVMAIVEGVRRDRRAAPTFHFSMFVILSTLWLVTDSGLFQFLIPHKGVSYLLFGCSFYLLCSPFAMFMARMVPERRQLFGALSMANSSYALLRIALYVGGILDFEAALWILHLIIATLILGVNITLLKPILRTRQLEHQELFWATTSLVLIAGAALVRFYAENKLNMQRNGYSSGFYLGIISFVVIVAIGELKKARQVRHQAFKAAFFEQRAYTDDMTGLLNVKGFDDKCAALLRDAPTGGCYAVVDFDVNFFSQYNASNGLEAGDDLLKKMADTLRRVYRQDELCARQEADHFVCIVHGDTLEGVLERIRSTDRTVRESLNERMLLMSYGVVEVKDRSLSPATLRNHALVAKHTVKGNYEQTIAVYDRQLHEAQLEDMEILSGFETALESNEYVIFLQPKIDATTERLRGAEALVRRVLPDGSVTSAWTIIKALESKGFVGKLDFYILEQVCRFLRRCIDEGRSVSPVSSNFSRVHLYDPDFPARIAEIVDKYQLPYDLVEIELTETAFLVGKDTLQTMVWHIHEQGFRVAIDDFGSGYSSLNMLKDVDVDVIKLDKEFLEECTQNSRADAVIEHTMRLAQEMNIATVAEGVENADQLAFLRRIGCDMIQGYYFSRPLPEDEFIKRYLSEQETVTV